MTQSLEEKLAKEQLHAERAYIEAKLLRFELEQVQRPFNETWENQGSVRALAGAVQRGALELVSEYWPYVAKTEEKILALKTEANRFERDHKELPARQLFHLIRDAPESEVPTYKKTRLAFKRLKREIAGAEGKLNRNPISRTWNKLHSIATYRNNEIYVAAGILALGIVAAVNTPVHRWAEYKDKHRPVYFAQYDPEQIAPITRDVIAARNVAMHFHKTWNEHHDDSTGGQVATEWDNFIAPGTGKYARRLPESPDGRTAQAYEDYTHPWGEELKQGQLAARASVGTLTRPLQLVQQGAAEETASWNVHHDHQTHTEIRSYPCGTSKQPRTCHTLVTVCDRDVYDWTLDAAKLRSGVTLLDEGRSAIPKLPAPNVQRWLANVPQVPREVRHKGVEEIQAALEFMNGWQNSPLLKSYDELRHNTQALHGSPVVGKILNDLPTYPLTFHNVNESCGGPTDYPLGWSEHQQLLDQARSAIAPYDALQQDFATFDKILPAVEKDMIVLRDRNSDKAQVQGAMRDLADTAYRIENANNSGGGWHPTHLQQLLLEAGLGLGVLAAAGFGAVGLLQKYRENKFVRRLCTFADTTPIADSYRDVLRNRHLEL